MKALLFASLLVAMTAVSPSYGRVARASVPAVTLVWACTETPTSRLDDPGQPPASQAFCLGAFETFHWFASVGELHPMVSFCIPLDDTTLEVIHAFMDFAHAPGAAQSAGPIRDRASHA